ncbi:MAG: hypothetical protein FJ128_12080 [Deltaproteobacteria bacterium]|nr:hypothetical protein [Deltaproteobacteria bacterium]
MHIALMLALGLALAGAGCSPCKPHVQTDEFPAPSWNPPRLAAPRIETAQRLYTHPPVNDCRALKAGVLLFRCAPEFTQVSYPVTQIFIRRLLEKKPFRDVVLIPAPYTSQPEALRRAKSYHVDLLVLGEIPYFLDSGTVGQSGVQVDLEVVDARTGAQLWFFSDSVKATPRPIISLIVVETRPKPTPPIYDLVDQLAGRMVDLLYRGAPAPPPPKKSWAIWK